MRLKKNQLNNVLFVMVDKTDFATPEALDAADINVKLYGVAQGASTAASTITVTKTPTSVTADKIFQITLEADETDAHDHYMLRLSSTSTVSCALQFIPLEMDDVSNSDIHSLLSDANSDLRSLMLDVQSAADSQFLVVSNYLSNASNYLSNISLQVSEIQSTLDSQFAVDSNYHSDLRSLISTSGGAITASDISDIASRVWSEKWRVHSLASSFGSAFSALWTDADNAASRALLNQSAINSQFAVTSNYLSNASNYLSNISLQVSEIQSTLDSQFAVDSNYHSDLRSLISTSGGAVTASNISDIASAVWAEKYRVHSLASSFGSAFSVLWTRADEASSRTSGISDVLSKVSDAQSDHHSDLRSLISTSGGTVTVSNISDIASAVWGEKWRVHSLASTFGSAFSTLWTRADEASSRTSSISDHHSDLRSLISTSGGTVTASNISDIASAVWAEKWRVHSLASSFGSAFSALWTDAGDAASRALLIQSTLNSHILVASDYHSDLRSLVSTSGGAITASNISDIASAVWGEKWRVHSLASTFGSAFSVLWTRADEASSRTSGISDVLSKVSDAQSDHHSDLRSLVSTSGGAITVSNISDIASAVWAEKYRVHSLASSFGSAFSAVWTSADEGASRALLNQSRISDVHTAVDSQFAAVSDAISNVQSTLDSHIVIASDFMSNMESRVPKAVATQSQVAGVSAEVSKVQSTLDSHIVIASDFMSNMESRVTKVVATQSQVTALAADLPNRPTKNVALANFQFLLVNSTDHVTPETGETVTAERSIDGGAFAACANAVAELASGIYTIDLAASDLNGDVITLKFSSTNADTRYVTIVTQST